MNIDEPSESEFEVIKKYIAKFELDDRELLKEEFLAAIQNSEIFGFARMRKHATCDEYCTLGVIETQRSQGVAKEITKAIIQKSTQSLYLVCIIPEYFQNLGFSIVETYPSVMQQKLDYCSHELVVEEKYVVMKFTQS